MQTMTLEPPLNCDGGIGEPSLVRRPVVLRERITFRFRAAQSREQVARSLTQLVEDAFLVDTCKLIPHLRDALDELLGS